jgi:hypothetical protein
MTKKPLEEQELFIRITSPNIFRRNLLETSKLILTILKQIYTVKQIREAKQEIGDHLSREIKELSILVQRVEDLMPQYTKADLKKLLPELTFIKKPEPQPKQEPEKPEEKPKPKPVEKPISEIDKVTKALEDIQRKLSYL